jgi:hypothetical protein
MAQVDPLPPEEELKKRRRPKYIINPSDVSEQDTLRVKQWAMGILKKYESKLGFYVQDKQIITTGNIEPEAIDIKNIYPFPDLHWIIFRDGMQFSLMLISKNKMLFKYNVAKI